MYYFPSKGTRVKRQNLWLSEPVENNVPHYDVLQFHFDAGVSLYADDRMEILCGLGEPVELVRDLSLNARHALNDNRNRFSFGFDGEFPALIVTTSIAASTPHLLVGESFASHMTIVVMRSPSPTWATSFAMTGKFIPNSSSSTPYQTSGGGTSWTWAPINIQRQNGVGQTPGTALTNIDQPFVLIVGHKMPTTVQQWMIGAQSNTQGTGSHFLYEVMLCPQLPIEQIQAIETYLMDKYGISGG